METRCGSTSTGKSSPACGGISGTSTSRSSTSASNCHLARRLHMHTKLQADVVRVLALVFAFSAQTVFAQPDPADPGPLAGTVQRIEYNFGDTAFTPSAWPPQ